MSSSCPVSFRTGPPTQGMKEAAIRSEASSSCRFYRLPCRDTESRLSRVSAFVPRSACPPVFRVRISGLIRGDSTFPDDPVFRRGFAGSTGAARRSACSTARLVRFRLSGEAGIRNEGFLSSQVMGFLESPLFTAGSRFCSERLTRLVREPESALPVSFSRSLLSQFVLFRSVSTGPTVIRLTVSWSVPLLAGGGVLRVFPFVSRSRGGFSRSKGRLRSRSGVSRGLSRSGPGPAFECGRSSRFENPPWLFRGSSHRPRSG